MIIYLICTILQTYFSCWLRTDNYFILSFVIPAAVVIMVSQSINLFPHTTNLQQTTMKNIVTKTWKIVNRFATMFSKVVCCRGVSMCERIKNNEYEIHMHITALTLPKCEHILMHLYWKTFEITL